MKFVGWSLMLLVLAVGSNACFEPPQFPIVPQINSSSVVFRNVADPTAQDTLILTLTFKDGDGDLGLDANNPADAEGIYASQYYFTKEGFKIYFPVGTPVVNPVYIQFQNSSVPVLDSLISYKTKRMAAGKANDTLPAFVTPFNCTNWSVITKDTNNNQIVVDTLYSQINPNTYNIFVDVLVGQGGNVFTPFNWNLEHIYPNCAAQGLNGRFPILASDPSKPAPLEGTIRYAMPSYGWLVTFSTKPLELRVSIQDRALHRSNVIITEPFSLK